MDGWIKLHRSILNSTIFDNPNLLKFWLWCLCKAYHCKTIQRVGIQEIEVNKGQFIFGRFEASIELKMNPNTIYKYLQLLQKEKMIAVKSNNKFSIITIVKYSEYQDSDDKKEQQNNNKITTKEQQNNTNKNVKNYKNVKKDIIITTIYQYIESNFGILLGGTNLQKVDSWLLYYTEDILQYAVDISVSNGKRTISYFEGILNNWKGNGYKTLQDIKESEIKRVLKEREPIKLEEIEDYDWLNEEE